MGRPQNRWHPCPSVPLQPKDHLRGCVMSELESSLNKILEEHQHESGLHMIGGRRKLLDRSSARGRTTDFMLTTKPISRKTKRITVGMTTRITCLLGEGVW